MKNRNIHNSLSRLLPQSIKSKGRVFKKLFRMGLHDLRRGSIARIFPLKPVSISMMVNDICNSKCKMCLIWEQKKDTEITPDELGDILREPLFQNVSDIGVTGGEPTLRKDLPEIYRSIVKNAPQIRHASIITNAIQEKNVIDRILASNEVCSNAGVAFSAMVSLDGVGSVHDINRGREGNFETAIRCIETLKNAGINTSFGCTITKGNVFHVDELLDYAQERGWYGRFRVAEFITRLYNDDLRETIRNFDTLEAYHLALFFFRASIEFEKHEAYLKTYRSIIGMLSQGLARSTGCAYHHDTVILTSKAELLYCSPKSPNLGSILKPGTASQVFFKNLGKRDQIKKDHCDQCIHDYHVSPTLAEKLKFYFESKRREKKYNLNTLLSRSKKLSNDSIKKSNIKSDSVLIVGWYGTETAGDKAILWSLINELRNRDFPPYKISVSSFNPFITQYTLKELSLSGIQIVETYSKEFETECSKVDEVIIGGGPLMSLDALDHLLYAFIEASKRNAVCHIAGCGIGPIDGERYVSTVRNLLQLASVIRLRDAKSSKWANDNAGINAEVIPDPATSYVKAFKNNLLLPLDRNQSENESYDIACYLRELTTEYSGADNLNSHDIKSKSVINDLTNLLGNLAKNGFRIRLFAMHNFSIGGDDRKLNRLIIRKIKEKYGDDVVSRVSYAAKPMSPYDILKSMTMARLCICMRFHSVLFASELDVPFVAIDYTNGGKIRSYLSSRNQLEKMFSLEDISSGSVISKVINLLNT